MAIIVRQKFNRFDDKSFEKLLLRFKKKIIDSGVIKDYRDSTHFIPKSQKRRKKKIEALNRYKKMMEV